MNAPFTYASPTLTVDALKHSIAYKLMFTIGKDPSIANKHEWLNASLLAVRAEVAPVVGTFHAATDSSVGYAAAQPWLGREIKKVARRTAVSEVARDLAQRYFPGDYRIVPNGIDVDRFASAAPLDLGEGPKILFLGRGFGDVVPYVVMILVLLVRPSGLFRTKELTRV